MSGELLSARWVLRIAAVLGVLAVAVAVALIFFVALARVRGDDMLPGLGDGAGMLVNRNATPVRGDLILFENMGKTRVRRVIGMPGEKLEFDKSDGMVPIVNGERASYEDRYEVDLYGRRMKVVLETIGGVSHEVIDDPKRRLKGVPEVQTGDGYYVMADFREYGNDSRLYGVIPASTVHGVVWFVWSRGDTLTPAKPQGDTR